MIGEDAAYRYPGEIRDALAGVDLVVRSAGRPSRSSARTAAASRRSRCMLAGLLPPRVGGHRRGARRRVEAASRSRGQRDLARHRHRVPGPRAPVPGTHGPRRAAHRAAARGLSPRGRGARVDDLLERLRLAHLAEANPFTLSGGEQRRLSVATALATAPRLLVLDEPTFGQDRRTWAELVHLLAALRDDGRASASPPTTGRSRTPSPTDVACA